MIASKKLLNLIKNYKHLNISYTFSSDKIPQTPEEKQQMTKPYMVAPHPIE